MIGRSMQLAAIDVVAFVVVQYFHKFGELTS